MKTLLFGIAVVATWGLGQATPSFEVVSIRRNTSGQQQGGGLAAPQPGGRFTGIGVTVRRLIGDAYDVQSLQIAGAPDWIDADRFDISAKGADNATPGEIRLMLRQMLVERFTMRSHMDTRQMPVFALLPARKDGALGPHIRPSDAQCAADAATYFPAGPSAQPPCGDFRRNARSLQARGMTLARLARLLGQDGRVGLDRTGLRGSFDLELEWAANDEAPSMFTALQEQLGLKLEATTGPVEVLVIDRVERPTEN